MFGGTEQGTALNTRNTRQHTHERSAGEMREAAARTACEMCKHLFGAFEVRDYTVGHWRNYCHVARFASVHPLRLVTDCQHFAGDRVQCNQRWLIENYTTAFDVDNRRSRAHCNGKRIGDECTKAIETDEC